MNPNALACIDEDRRDLARSAGLNGIDYVEVETRDENGKPLPRPLLHFYFLARAPRVKAANIVISGGRRVTDIAVAGEPEFCPAEDPRKDDCMRVWLNKPGDASTYTVCLVDVDEKGRPIPAPDDQPGGLPYRVLPGFDPRYACIDFTFAADCRSDLDCGLGPVCPPETRPAPEINYLAKDYDSFRQLILDRLAILMPDWQERHAPDLGITLVELLAYVGDSLSYYQDAVATEAYLDTARRRISVRRHARLVDYIMHEGCNARAWVAVHCGQESYKLEDVESVFFVTSLAAAHIPPGRVLDQETLDAVQEVAYEVFRPVGKGSMTLYKAHNEISFYTWGDTECCLPRGATSATLDDLGSAKETPADPDQKPLDYDGKPTQGQDGTGKDAPRRATHLEPGDILILEEVCGPRSGLEADADPRHRHAVRLTSVKPVVDPVNGRPVVEIEWGQEDALPFPVCISSVGPAADCCPLENISVARGNVLLVDHGQRVTEQDPLQVSVEHEPIVVCEDVGRPVKLEMPHPRFNPRLDGHPVTHAAGLPPDEPGRQASAAEWMRQDPRQAMPAVALTEEAPDAGRIWEARRDLLASGPDDRVFVVEIDDDGSAWLRFGDGVMGAAPRPGATLTATYRVGSGAAGNVGAETIVHLGLDGKTESGVELVARNPLPATGGVGAEPAAEVKLFAPFAFRRQLARAIIASDYATLAQRHRRVQAASGELRWTGSWYEARVALDPLGTDEVNDELIAEVTELLRPYRRIGHDLAVTPARYVPLRLEMVVCVKPGYLRGHVKAALLDLFSSRALPDGRLGLFHPDNLSFGNPIYLSKLLAAVMQVEGVETAYLDHIRRLDVPGDREDEQARQTGVLPLAPFEVPRLDNDPAQPENGTLVLTLKGGR